MGDLPAAGLRVTGHGGRPGGGDLFSQVEASGASTVACDSETCRWQIAHGTGRASVHPIDYLYRAYGLDRPSSA